MNRLLDLGFINVGHWTLDNESLKCHLISHESRKNVLYSFIKNGVVKYIGKTTMPLSKRMYGYQNPGRSQITNIRVNKCIKELLTTNEPVDIFILSDNGLLKYGDFQISLAAGLEDKLISDLSPEWNSLGKSKIEKNKEYVNKEAFNIANQMDLKNKLVSTIEVRLGKAYYYHPQGFFNIKVANSEEFGEDKSHINIQLGNDSNNVIQGYVNRTANPNGTPRIMCGKRYLAWIQSNFRIGDILTVEIWSQVFIKLNEKRVDKV